MPQNHHLLQLGLPGLSKEKTSFKRLSDVLQGGGGVGGKKDMWLVVFSAMLCYVVNALVRLLSLWEVPMLLQGRIPCLRSKESPNTLLQAAETHPRGHGISTNSSRRAPIFFPKGRHLTALSFRLRIGLLATSSNPVKASCQWKSKLHLNFVMKGTNRFM